MAILCSSGSGEQKMRSDTYLIVLSVEGSSSTSRWRTTISYYPNEEMKFIKFWFVKAPDSMNITSYIVTISRVIDNEQTSEEKRELLESLTINKVSPRDSRLHSINEQRFPRCPSSLNGLLEVPFS